MTQMLWKLEPGPLHLQFLHTKCHIHRVSIVSILGKFFSWFYPQPSVHWRTLSAVEIWSMNVLFEIGQGSKIKKITSTHPHWSI
jgi:hypothetical protein